jgi:hypothetical protein
MILPLLDFFRHVLAGGRRRGEAPAAFGNLSKSLQQRRLKRGSCWESEVSAASSDDDGGDGHGDGHGKTARSAWASASTMHSRLQDRAGSDGRALREAVGT